MSDEIDAEVVEQLKISEKLRGPIEKVVLNAQGKLVDGHQRKAADPDWPEEVNEKLKTEEDCILFEIDKNWHRTNKSESWKLKRIERLARLGNSVSDVIRKTGLKEATVYRHYPQELKNQKISEATSVGMQRVSELSRQSLSSDRVPSLEDLQASEDKLKSKIEECHNCHLGFRHDQLIPVGSGLYCSRCAPNASIAYKNETKKLEQPEKPVSPRELSTYAHREAERHVPHSKQELEFVKLAEDDGSFGPIITDRAFYAVKSVPDAYAPKQKWIAYVDGKPHEGREDKDEKLRELIGKANDVRVFVFKIGVGKPVDWLKKLKELT